MLSHENELSQLGPDPQLGLASQLLLSHESPQLTSSSRGGGGGVVSPGGGKLPSGSP